MKREKEISSLMILVWIGRKQSGRISLLKHLLIRWTEGILIQFIGRDPGKGCMFFSRQHTV